MIVTVTLSPALDCTLELPGPLAVGDVQRAVAPGSEVAAGKGVNVSRVLRAAGVPTKAIVVASPEGRFAELLEEARLPVRYVDNTTPVRRNLAIIDPRGTTTKINEPAPAVSGTAFAGVRTAVRQQVIGADWLVIAGTMPAGIAPRDVRALIDEARSVHPALRIAVDSSGAALAAAFAPGAASLVKPNEDELAAALALNGMTVDPSDTAAVVARAREVAHAGGPDVLLTLGADGAVLATADQTFRATPPPITVRSTVGAGDASLAGYLIADALGATTSERLRYAVAYGAAAAALPGTAFPTPDALDLDHVAVATLTP